MSLQRGAEGVGLDGEVRGAGAQPGQVALAGPGVDHGPAVGHHQGDPLAADEAQQFQSGGLLLLAELQEFAADVEPEPGQDLIHGGEMAVRGGRGDLGGPGDVRHGGLAALGKQPVLRSG